MSVAVLAVMLTGFLTGGNNTLSFLLPDIFCLITLCFAASLLSLAPCHFFLVPKHMQFSVALCTSVSPFMRFKSDAISVFSTSLERVV
jgi:hypothetical protein